MDPATLLVVTPQTSGADFLRIETSMADVADAFVAYDIYLMLNGQRLSSPLPYIVTVTLPLPAGYDATNTAIYYVAPDGTKTAVACTVDAIAGTVTFQTDHFSDYVIAKLKASANEPTPTPSASASATATPSTPSNPNPPTSDTTSILLVLLFVVGVAGAITIVVAKKRNDAVA